eukprot:g14050.t1
MPMATAAAVMRRRERPEFLRAAGLCLAVACARSGLASASAGSIRLTECPEDAPEPSFDWENGGDQLYVRGEGACVTPADIYNGMDDPPLVYHTAAGEESSTETGIWLMTRDIFMETGTTLLLHDDLGCTELRIASSSTNHLHLRGYGAYISLLRTKVTSWSVGNQAPDNGAKDGNSPRSYMSVISLMEHPSDTCEGAASDSPGEARMDIINSEVAYLGWQAPESYGLTYKVRGFCKDLSNPEVFDRVNVRGDIRFSDIHHNWFGLYTYGHQDGNWEHNLMHDSGYYGFDPHDDSDNLRIHDNTVWNNGNHGIIASKRCNDVSIQNNVVFDNAQHGIMLHRSSDMGIIRNNTVTGSGSACIAIFESFDIEISDNVCENNAEGIRLSMGSSNNKIFDNVVTNTEGRSLWMYLGSDPVEASEATDGMCADNLWQNNRFEKSSLGVVMKDTLRTQVIGNTFIDTDKNQWKNSDGLLWKGNEIDSGFDMAISETCINSDSDLDQIDDAGGYVKEC